MARILVIDEQPGRLAWYAHVLLVDGHEVVGPAPGGDYPPDVIIVGSGSTTAEDLEAARHLCAAFSLPTTPVILVIPGPVGRVPDSIASGDRPFLLLPDSSDEERLREAVRGVLASSPAPGIPPARPVDPLVTGAGLHVEQPSRFSDPAPENAFFHEVFSAVPTALLVLDLDRIRHANREAERLLSYEEGDLAGRRVHDVLLGLPRPWPPAPAQDAVEVRGYRKTGEVFPCGVRIGALPTGGASALLLTLTDLTERRLLEAQLGTALRQEAIGRLACGLAHEFNDMLTLITGYSTLADDDGGAARRPRAPLAEIRAAAERASQATRRLVAFSRRRTRRPEPLDVNQVLLGLADTLRAMGEGLVMVRLDLAPEVGLVRADACQLEEIVLELVLHVRKGLPHGGTVHVRTLNHAHHASPRDADVADPSPLGDHVVVEVSDGPPLPAVECGLTGFQPFSRRLEEGLEPALAITNGLVRQNGGHMLVAGAGVHSGRVGVCLPRVDVSVRPAAISRARVPEAAWPGQTILLVEDEDSLLELMERLLKGAGYAVLSARTAAEALALSEQHPGAIDLVLTDVALPGMTGPDLVERLAVMRPTARVMFVSGLARERLPARVRFLPKPFAPSTLIVKVREALEATG